MVCVGQAKGAVCVGVCARAICPVSMLRFTTFAWQVHGLLSGRLSHAQFTGNNQSDCFKLYEEVTNPSLPKHY